MVRFAIHGTGRMAAAIATASVGRDDVSLMALVGPQTPEWQTDVAWFSSFAGIDEIPDFLIDFTLPEGTRVAAEWCADQQVPLLSGVTGLSDEISELLKHTGAKVPVLWSPNLSLGVNLLADLAERAGSLLDSDVQVTIEDIHHQWKKDAPSGTSLMLGGRIAESRAGDDRAIEYRSVREGEVIGEHTISFSLDGEAFDLVHRAHDRSIYARGALDAGYWLVRQPPGMYSARDWLSGRR
jgi:4-hydroxy-tetrahydrodipicolinate reductase